MRKQLVEQRMKVQGTCIAGSGIFCVDLVMLAYERVDNDLE
jgi:hypothetical protein